MTYLLTNNSSKKHDSQYRHQLSRCSIGVDTPWAPCIAWPGGSSIKMGADLRKPLPLLPTANLNKGWHLKMPGPLAGSLTADEGVGKTESKFDETVALTFADGRNSLEAMPRILDNAVPVRHVLCDRLGPIRRKGPRGRILPHAPID